jgi:cob(I)alamin adenosyltransferase
MTINNPNIELVIAVLNGINVDGESMQYIIEKVGMTDQMKSQLGVATEMPEDVINQIAEDISIDLDNEGLDLIEDQEYGINSNEIYLEDVTYDRYRMEKVIKDVLESHFKSIE